MNLFKRMAEDLFFISQDDTVLQKSRKLSLRWTAVFWIFFCFAGFIMHFKPLEPEYKEIRITLSPVMPADKIVEKPVIPQTIAPQNPPAPEAAAPKTAPVKEAVPAVKPQQTAKKAEQPKYTISKPQTYAKSNEELMAEQMASSQKQKTWDDSMFGENPDAVSSQNTAVSPEVKKISDAEAVRGSAGTASSSSAVSSSSSTARSSSSSIASSSASGETKEALAAIGSVKSVPYSSVSGNGTSSTSLISASIAGGGISIAMTNGTVRRLLDPEKPVITISDENAKLIDASRTVTITFKVLAAGNVPLSGIQIHPASTLAAAVQSEIKSQIAKWRFASDPSESMATFEYSIIKK